MKRTKKSIIVSLSLAASMAVSALSGFAASFSDVASDSWYKTYIDYVTEKGYMTGDAEGTFRPTEYITRAEFVTVLVNMTGVTTKTSNTLPDVAEDAWYADYMSKGVAAGYITGYEDGTYKPESYISREEACVVIYRLAGLAPVDTDVCKFTDVSEISEWAKQMVNKLVYLGVITGYDDGSFKPGNPITRAEVCVLLKNMEEKIDTTDTSAAATATPSAVAGAIISSSSSSSSSSLPSASSSGGSSSGSSSSGSSSSATATPAPTATPEPDEEATATPVVLDNTDVYADAIADSLSESMTLPTTASVSTIAGEYNRLTGTSTLVTDESLDEAYEVYLPIIQDALVSAVENGAVSDEASNSTIGIYTALLTSVVYTAGEEVIADYEAGVAEGKAATEIFTADTSSEMYQQYLEFAKDQYDSVIKPVMVEQGATDDEMTAMFETIRDLTQSVYLGASEYLDTVGYADYDDPKQALTNAYETFMGYDLTVY